MKSIKNLISDIVSDENLEKSLKYVTRGSRKKYRECRDMIKNKDELFKRIKEDIVNGTFKIKAYQEKLIKESDKIRRIQIVNYYDRVVLNAIMNVLEARLLPKFIADTASSMKGRGCIYLYERTRKDIVNHPNETRYVYKCDIRKFYESIDQDIMVEKFNRICKDKVICKIIEGCIRLLPEKGLSIGLRSSQVLGNLYLNDIDHYMKDKLGCKYYRRYCDDIVIQAGSKKEIEFYIKELKKQIDNVKLVIKQNEQMFDINDRPIDFLGYVIHANGYTTLRKRIKKNAIKNISRVKSHKRKKEILSALYGRAKHCESKHLIKSIIERYCSYDQKITSESGDISYKRKRCKYTKFLLKNKKRTK